ncbi:MAG: DUF488 domain-containing protein [Terracidiphilus sp.]|jgi:hypothetical protein
MSSFFTIGHSNHEFPAWLALLRLHAVEVVVDARSSPYSKYFPQFDRELMQRGLEQAGIRYLFFGAELGGRPENPAYYDGKGRVLYSRLCGDNHFQAAIVRLESGIERFRVAVVCGEEEAVTDPKWLDLLNLMPAGIYPHTLLCGGKQPMTYLTISLSEAFEGFHYKLVAGVVMLPA